MNRERSRFEQVKRFVVLPRDFRMEHGEVTPTLKLRRRAVIENFQSEIDRLYSSPQDLQSRPAWAFGRRGCPCPVLRPGQEDLRAPTQVDAYQDS